MTADRRDHNHRRPGKNSYHPYRSGRSSGTSSGPRLVSVADALKTDRILSIENFVNVEKLDPEEKSIASEYFGYVEKHQVAFLKSLHKKDKGISNASEGNQDEWVDPYPFDEFKWGENLSLKYSSDFGFKSEGSSNSEALGSPSGSESFLCPRNATENLPFKDLLLKYNSETVAMSNIPAYVDKKALERHLKAQVPSCEIELGQPNADKNYYRLGWLTLPEDTTDKLTEIVPKLEALGSIEGAKIYFGIASSNFRRFKVSDVVEGSDKDLCLLAANLIRYLQNFDKFEIDEATTTDYENLLDKLVTYLRKAFNFCFYCCAQYGCPRELVEKCGDLHLRRTVPVGGAGDSSSQQNRFVERVKTLSSFIRTMNGVIGSCQSSHYSDVDVVLTESSIKKVDEAKYRCEHCAKAFKGPEFVLKHLHLKHEDVVKATGEEISRFCDFLKKAKLWMFPSSMIPRYSQIRNNSYNNPYKSGFKSSSQQSSNSSISSSRGYVDWDAAAVGSNPSIEISYDL